MFTEELVAVSRQPRVELFVARTTGPSHRTVLVIHGGPDWDHTYLREPLSKLAGTHRLVMPDLRGCGRSTRGLSDDQYTPDTAVDDLIILMDTIGVDRADVLGFSYGGLLAQRLALAAPHRVRRLVLASTTVEAVPADAFDDWPDALERRATGARVWSNPHLAGPELTRAAAVAAAPANLWRHELLPAYLRRLESVRFSAEWLRPLRAGILPQAVLEDAVPRLAALAIPMLFLHGRYDMTFPAHLVQRAAGTIPSAGVKILESAGHMAHVDQPDAWLAAVSPFLD
ncbi:alpha/beta hydrolase [Streptomyces sp. MBT65]|uniref:alpha/beta fold hydrolase n=1 Tax=Streptomyces sp. MBT65 TaxID=1488395 RepID=UPI00190A514B|nr:alpha/beta hydrolase [Streptomyces sp. MBT65]MBK3573070.1 alpha/beta hydrolase [Streptomyces sp. MBT65]